MPRAVVRRRVGVTNRADRRTRAAEKLFAVTAETGFVPRVIRDVGKRLGFSDRFPVFRRKFMARIAFHLMNAVIESSFRGS